MRFLLPLLILISCGGPAPEGMDGIKNVVLFTFDTTRADYIGCYGNANANTPRIDALAKSGVRFKKCFSVGPTTLPSHASILTGQYPFAHGVRNNGTHALPESAQTLAEILHDQGFQTGAVVSAMVLNSRYGLAQGFDRYDDNLSSGAMQPSFLLRETSGDDTARRALDFLESADGLQRIHIWGKLDSSFSSPEYTSENAFEISFDDFKGLQETLTALSIQILQGLG